MDKKEQWINEVFKSVEGMEKASPSAELFAKISKDLPVKREVKVISFTQLKWMAVAASLVVGINILVFTSSLKENETTAIQSPNEYKLITDLALYK